VGWLERLFVKAQAPFFLGARTSPRSNLWVLAYQTLTLPLSLWRHIHHFRATVEGTEIRIVCVGRRKRFRDLLDGLFGPVEGGPARRNSTIDGAPARRWSAPGSRSRDPEAIAWGGVWCPPTTERRSERLRRPGR